MESKTKIRKFITDNLIVWEDNVHFNDDDDIFKLGYVNSLFAMKLLNFVEQEFSIRVDNDEIQMENFSSVSNINKLVIRKLSPEHVK